jgi:hypothetical protein
MKRAHTLLLVGCLLLLWNSTAEAQLAPVGPLNVTTAVAGSQPAPVVALSSYAATLVFGGQMKVVGSLNANMQVGTTLSVQLTAPSGGTSLGAVNLDVTNRDLVIASTPVFYTNVTIRYTFTPTVAAGVIPLSTRTATFTLLTYP